MASREVMSLVPLTRLRTSTCHSTSLTRRFAPRVCVYVCVCSSLACDGGQEAVRRPGGELLAQAVQPGEDGPGPRRPQGQAGERPRAEFSNLLRHLSKRRQYNLPPALFLASLVG